MYVVLYFKLSVLHIAYFLGPFLFVSFFCLSWHDTWSCGLSCFLLNENVMLFNVMISNMFSAVLCDKWSTVLLALRKKPANV